MKFHISYLLLFFFCLSNISALAQEQIDTSLVPTNLWSNKNANTLKQGRKVWPILGIKKMGARNNMEWQIQPLFFFISPHIGLKKHWTKSKKGISLASFHRLNYPSIYLKLIAREGTGGILPSNSIIPHIISSKNEVFLGLNSNQNFFTLRVGFALAFSFGDKDFPEIDFPFAYRRTAAYQSNFTPHFGLNFHRDLFSKLNLEIDFAVFQMNNATGGFIFENRVLLFWKKSDRFGIKAGAASAFGRYPYGFDFRLIPVFDVLFGFGGIKKGRR